jgi:anti-sigma regulatory factor (Ser/Thr protein kinase)
MTLGVAAQTGAKRRTNRYPAHAADDMLNLRLGGGAQAAVHARRALVNLSSDLDRPTMETLRLLVTELITNSVKHAGASRVGMKVAVGTRSVIVEVSDAGPGFEPVARSAQQDDTSGWGLFLVERLARRWGVTRDGGATKVWFELPRAA